MLRGNGMGPAALLVAGLLLAGCGGDDNGLSSEDMARIAALEEATMTAQAEAEAAKADAAAAQEEATAAQAEATAAKADAAAAQAEATAARAEAEKEVVIPEPDTSALDAVVESVATLEATVEALTAEPATPAEILGGTKGTASAADLSVAAMEIAGQLKATYDHDGDRSRVNLPDLLLAPGETGRPEKTRNVSHAAARQRIMSSDGTLKDKGFLQHTFAGGPVVNLTSPGDIETLTLKDLLRVNGVDLTEFSLRETDKVKVEAGNLDADGRNAFITTGAEDGDPAATRTTTLAKNGSMSVVVVDDVTRMVVMSTTTTYVGGDTKIVEHDPIVGSGTNGAVVSGDVAAAITLADRRVMQYQAAGPSSYMMGPVAGAAAAELPSTDYTAARKMYNDARAPTYTIPQHNARGYGAWLVDSFFVAYVINAEDDLIISDPDDRVEKIAWGGRTHASEVADSLSGRGETAMWKGLMVGHDMKGSGLVKGNASVTARVSDAVLADQANAGRTAADVVDVSLTNIITGDGTAVSRVANGIHWTNLNLSAGSFNKGSEISGAFYDNGNEVVGQFEKEDILGVFGAMEYEMMDGAMDMASQ